MTFDLEQLVSMPRAEVWALLLADPQPLAGHLPGVLAVVEQSSAADGEQLERSCGWQGCPPEAPSIVRPLVSSEHLLWSTQARWDRSTWSCAWSVQHATMPGGVALQGTTRLGEEAGATLVRLQGALQLEPGGLDRVPGFLARRAIEPLQQLLLDQIRRNLVGLGPALEAIRGPRA